MPLIGEVMVVHASLDKEIRRAICEIGQFDFSTAAPFFSEVQSTTKRAEILRNLAWIKLAKAEDVAKIIVLVEIIKKCTDDRNILAHSVPHSVNPQTATATYVKDVVLTFPQLSTKSPYVATIPKLRTLVDEMFRVSVWLGMLQRICLPEEVTLEGVPQENRISFLREHCVRHPDWEDDKKFPWQVEFAKKIDVAKRRKTTL